MPKENRDDGRLILITGKSRSGKTQAAIRLSANDQPTSRLGTIPAEIGRPRGCEQHRLRFPTYAADY